VTFDFYVADSLCRATYRIDGETVHVLGVTNVTSDRYQFPVRLDRDGLDAVAALIREGLEPVRVNEPNEAAGELVP
jgi:hypothetical protein